MKLLHIYCFLLLICSSSIIFQTCNSHGIMTFPTPRSGIGRDPNNPSSIIKLQPIQTYQNKDGQNGISLVCGGAPNADPGKSTVPPENAFRPGASFNVIWDVPIPHPNPPGVKISVSYSDLDSFGQNILVPEGFEAGTGTNVKKAVTLPAGKQGNAVLKWQWCSTTDGGCYVTCADIKIDPSAPVSTINSGSNNNNNAVQATIDDGGGDGAGLTIFIVFLIIIIVVGLGYVGFRYWSKLEREKFEANIRGNEGAGGGGGGGGGAFAVGIKPKEGPKKTLQGGGAFAKKRQTIKDNSVKRRGMSFKDNTGIRRPPPTSRAGKLANGWHEAIDEASGDKYYYHDDGATCWDKPQPFDSRTPRFKQKSNFFGSGDALPLGWYEAEDPETGDIYYYTDDGRTTWDFPRRPAF